MEFIQYFLLILMVLLVFVVSAIVAHVIFYDKKMVELSKKCVKCPNCGFAPVIMNYKGCYRVECKVCGCIIDPSTFFVPEHAVSYWNRNATIGEEEGDE